jgi:hypothetical protein
LERVSDRKYKKMMFVERKARTVKKFLTSSRREVYESPVAAAPLLAAPVRGLFVIIRGLGGRFVVSGAGSGLLATATA